jgi:hypothetical protein
MTNEKLDINYEYNSLREELNQSKKYVFERPIAIVALVVAGIKIFDFNYIYIFPLLTLILFIFNFWFTANRLMSGTRIAAYIQVMIEENLHGKWVGWETCLRYYRKWINENEDRHTLIAPEIQTSAVPDALMYFPPIYYFHVGGVVFTLLISFFLLTDSINPYSNAFCIATIFTGFFSTRIFWTYRPSRMKTLIEENRVIWIKVIEYMNNCEKI